MSLPHLPQADNGPVEVLSRLCGEECEAAKAHTGLNDDVKDHIASGTINGLNGPHPNKAN